MYTYKQNLFHICTYWLRKTDMHTHTQTHLFSALCIRAPWRRQLQFHSAFSPSIILLNRTSMTCLHLLRANTMSELRVRVHCGVLKIIVVWITESESFGIEEIVCQIAGWTGTQTDCSMHHTWLSSKRNRNLWRGEWTMERSFPLHSRANQTTR